MYRLVNFDSFCYQDGGYMIFGSNLAIPVPHIPEKSVELIYNQHSQPFLFPSSEVTMETFTELKKTLFDNYPNVTNILLIRQPNTYEIRPERTFAPSPVTESEKISREINEFGIENILRLFGGNHISLDRNSIKVIV